MHPRLVVDRGAQRFVVGRADVGRVRGLEERLVQQHADGAVAGFAHVAAVDGVLKSGGGGERREGRREQVDKREAPLRGDFGDGLGIELEAGVLLRSGGQIRVAGRLERERRDQDEPRRANRCRRGDRSSCNRRGTSRSRL